MTTNRAAWTVAETEMRQAIDRHCRECIVDASKPRPWREQIEACPHDFCPLHGVRPTTQNAEPCRGH